jgi:hypothetical protein
MLLPDAIVVHCLGDVRQARRIEVSTHAFAAERCDNRVSSDSSACGIYFLVQLIQYGVGEVGHRRRSVLLVEPVSQHAGIRRDIQMRSLDLDQHRPRSRKQLGGDPQLFGRIQNNQTAMGINAVGLGENFVPWLLTFNAAAMLARMVIGALG